MGTLKGFLAPKKVENVKYIASDRFIDDNGKPLEWELRALSAIENEQLQKDCTYDKQVKGKRGQYRQDIDITKYTKKMITACVVTPDLNEIDVQNAYGVKCAEDVLGIMLTSGEYSNLSEKIMEINGFDANFEDNINTAKN